MEISEVISEEKIRARLTKAGIERLLTRGIVDPRMEPHKHTTDLYSAAREYDVKLAQEIKFIDIITETKT